MGGEAVVVLYRIPCRIIAVHVLVVAFDNVRVAAYMAHFGLFAEPNGKGVEFYQIVLIADAAGLAGFDRILDGIEAGQMFNGKLSVAS